MKKSLLSIYYVNCFLFIALLIPTLGYSQVSFTADVSEGCAPQLVSFNNTSNLPTADHYEWYFGDGDSFTQPASNPTVTHTYTYGDNFYIQVQAYDAGNSYLGSENMYINITGQPNQINNSTNNTDAVCPEDEISFWPNQSGDDFDSYTWDYGNGVTETNTYSSAWYMYPDTGTFVVELTMNSPTCGIYSVKDTIIVGSNLPVTNPSFSNETNGDPACPNDEIYFWTSWEYDFHIDYGDGNSTSDNDTEHSYENVGIYPVKVTLENGCGNDTILFDTINIQNGLPFNDNPYVDVYPNQVCPGGEVRYYAESGYSSYHWDFGDGATSDELQVTHSYNSPGDYPVEVTITNGCGNDTLLRDTARIVSNLYIQNAGIYITDSICPGDKVFFSANSDNDNDLYLWNFGDGSTVTDRGGVHQFDLAGTYNVSLSITNGCGNDTTIFTQVIVNSNVLPKLNAMEYGAEPEVTCVGDTVIFFAQPGGTGGFSWDFGDGNSSSSTEDFIINTEDGNFVVTYGKHAYSANGTYYAMMTFTNSCGNSVSDSVRVDVGTSSVVDDVDFFWDQTIYPCLGTEIEFFTLAGSHYEWDFGDGTGTLITTEPLQPVYHAFDSAGTYSITVTATNGCGDSKSASNVIFIPDSQIDLVVNAIDANCDQDNGTAIVSALGGTLPYTYQWTNGDDSNIADTLSSGIYVVTVTDANGCSNFGMATVSDLEAPTVLVNTVIDVSCNGGENGAIDINMIGSSAPYSFEWSNGKTSEDINNLQAGPYEVFVTDVNGCVATESVIVSEPTEVGISFVKTNPDCGISNGTATANVSGTTGPYTYIWSTGAGTATATGLGAGSYNITVIDQKSCLTTETIAISENDAPIIVVDSITDLGCGASGSSVYVRTFGGTDPITYNWDQINVVNNNISDSIHLLNVSAGTYRLTATGDDNCAATEVVEIDFTAPETQQICLVTVDDASDHNIITWAKPVTAQIKEYNIYKESSQSGLYFHIGTVPYDSLSEYTDTLSNPMVRSWRYKISAVDHCDNESELSDEHKTMHVTINLGLADNINLIWDHYDGLDVGTYNIHRYTLARGDEVLTGIADNLTSYTDLAGVLAADPDLYYYIAIDHPNGGCTATKAKDYNTSRSNRTNRSKGTSNDIKVENLPEFGLFPNPNNGTFTLTITSTFSDDSYVRILDVEGREIFTKQITQKQSIISLGEVESGIYFVQLISDNYSITKKLIKH